MPLKTIEITNLKPKEKDYQVPDGNGLSLIVRKKGTKTWLFQFRLNEAKGKYKYGSFPEISLDNARKLNAAARQLVALGRNPADLLDSKDAKQMIIDGYGIRDIEEKQAAIKKEAAVRALTTFGNAAEKYKAEWVDKNWKDPDKGWSPVRLHLLPKLSETALEAIEVSQLRELIYDIRERRGVAVALSCHNWASRIFGYSLEHEFCKINPAAAIKGKRIGTRNKRKRWLTTPEIRRYLTSLYQSSGYRGYKLALHLLLMLALRKNELCNAKWSEFNFDKQEWLIPSGRMKTKTDHWVMLPTQAIEMLQELKTFSAGSQWVMPMPTNSNRAMSGNNLDGTHEAALTAGNIVDYHIHDHRHTASTHLRERGFPAEVVETALSHAIPGMAGNYSHAEYKTQRLVMLQSWADFLDTVMTEKTVIQATFRKAM